MRQFGTQKQCPCVVKLQIVLNQMYNTSNLDDEIQVLYTEYEKVFDFVEMIFIKF